MEEKLKQLIEESDYLLVGIGEEWELKKFADEEEAGNAYGKLASILENKNYFILTTVLQMPEAAKEAFGERISFPQAETGEMSRWEAYMKWLQGSLNRRVLLLELGVGFHAPEVIRWPFERIVCLNRKAALYRVNETFYQLPETVGEQGSSRKENSIRFVLSFGK